MIEGGDKNAELIFKAMAYQVAKDIGSNATVLKGKVDGIILTGGGAKLKGLDKKLCEAVDLPVHVMPEALTCVIKGSGMILDNLEEYREVLIKKIEN
jgi:butyrate kinase